MCLKRVSSGRGLTCLRQAGCDLAKVSLLLAGAEWSEGQVPAVVSSLLFFGSFWTLSETTACSHVLEAYRLFRFYLIPTFSQSFSLDFWLFQLSDLSGIFGWKLAVCLHTLGSHFVSLPCQTLLPASVLSRSCMLRAYHDAQLYLGTEKSWLQRSVLFSQFPLNFQSLFSVTLTTLGSL